MWMQKYCSQEGTRWPEAEWYARSMNGNLIGRANKNSILDTHLYEVEYLGGEMTELLANIIAASLYAQCDVGRKEYLLLETFIDHWKNGSALSIEDQQVVIQGGETLIMSTAGWDICHEWKDGSSSTEKLSNFKESHPIQVAKYAVAQGITYEPAFNWWFHHVLKKRDQMISMVKEHSAWYLVRNHEFGLELHEMVKEAIAIDEKIRNALWQGAI